MTILQQIFDKLYDNDNKICTRKSLFEQFKQVNRAWLQQKQVPINIDTIFQDEEIRQRFLTELLEELEEEKRQ